MQLAAKFIVEEDDEAMQKELREAFRLYDKQGNGYIPTSCLREILRELDDQLTNEELDIMVEEIDSDGSGTVDFDGKWVGPISSCPEAVRAHTHTHTALGQAASSDRVNCPPVPSPLLVSTPCINSS